MSGPMPGEDTRWRCGGCGNLTRFDVVRTQRVKEFWHFDLAGHHDVDESETDRSFVETVTCRWCGRADLIELVPRVSVPGTAVDGGN